MGLAQHEDKMNVRVGSECESESGSECQGGSESEVGVRTASLGRAFPRIYFDTSILPFHPSRRQELAIPSSLTR